MNPYAVHSIRGSVTSLLKGVGNFNNDLVEYILGHAGDSVSQTNYERFDGNPELFTRQPLEFMEVMVDAEETFLKLILPPSQAQGRMDRKMPSGWQKKLLASFWEDESVKILEQWHNAHERHPNVASIIKSVIRQANDWRWRDGSPTVTPAILRRFMAKQTSGE